MLPPLPALPVVQRHSASASGPSSPAPAAPVPSSRSTQSVRPTQPPPPAPPAQSARSVRSVQRAPNGSLLPTSARATTAVTPVTAAGTMSHGSSGAGSAKGGPPPYDAGESPPEYTAVAKGQFDPRSLTDFQLDELTHRLIGRITRLIRTELRLDRERIGRLRDPRR
ncbi:hypothetical protein QFZ75_004123 [Streptomyces sp. V3I8]|uniref:extensin n=1 Tax=Streptomyces sp. V3I8 TaxID=3042279 RepID=UPI00277FA6EB|nr:extensin [Streptomyces sp. V3I8]MDQ1037707.1 hypothetical protein [Streptomyces sp. V3I8]